MRYTVVDMQMLPNVVSEIVEGIIEMRPNEGGRMEIAVSIEIQVADEMAELVEESAKRQGISLMRLDDDWSLEEED